MATTFLCQRAHMGSTTYYIGTMKAGTLVRSVGFVTQLPDWNEMTVDERIQRKIDEGRIKQEIVPYLQQDTDRFFGALIVDIYKGWEQLEFEPLKDIAKVPKAYVNGLENLGYLQLPGADYLVALDGQHRLKALKYAIFGDDDQIKSNLEITDDDITVIFVPHTNDKKIRNIFNKVNRYARSTSRGDNIITSEDDVYAILSRRLLNGESTLSQDNVNWRSNTLSQRSTNFTTISAIYETIKILLSNHDELNVKYKIRPSEQQLEAYFDEIFNIWDTILNGVNLFKDFSSDIIVSNRKKYLICKPAGLIALFSAIKSSMDLGCSLDYIIEQINNIDWNMNRQIWVNIIMKPDGAIIAKAENRELTARLIIYMICKNKLSKDFIGKLNNDFIIKRFGKEELNINNNLNRIDEFVNKSM